MAGYFKKSGIIVLVVFNVTFISTYWYNSMENRERPYPFLAQKGIKMFKRLSLSDEQRQKIRDSIKETFEKTTPIRQQIRIQRLEMLYLIFSDNPDIKTIETKRSEIADLQQKIQRLIINRIVEDKKIFTPLQQEKLFSYLKAKIEARNKGGEKNR